MASQIVTLVTERQITVWMPDNATNTEKMQLAQYHIAACTLSGEKSRLLSIEPLTWPTVDESK